MARTKKPSQRVKDNLACLVASQTTAPVDQGSTQTNGDQSQPANATQSSTSSNVPLYRRFSSIIEVALAHARHRLPSKLVPKSMPHQSLMKMREMRDMQVAKMRVPNGA